MGGWLLGWFPEIVPGLHAKKKKKGTGMPGRDDFKKDRNGGREG